MTPSACPLDNGGFMGVGPGGSLPVINTPMDFYAAAMALDGGALVGSIPGLRPAMTCWTTWAKPSISMAS